MLTGLPFPLACWLFGRVVLVLDGIHEERLSSHQQTWLVPPDASCQMVALSTSILVVTY